MAYLVMIFIILIFNCFIFREYKKNRSDDKFFYLITFVIVTVAIVVRFYNIESLPGLQIDEAMAGYDAWSIANYGVDSALNRLPIYLVSYGSGQSAVYAYMAVPFIKLLGLTIFSIRLPMLLVSTCTIFLLMYTLLKKMESRKLIVTILFFISINPWSIMGSRFGLDANIAPNLILQAICWLILGASTEKGKRIYYYSLSIILLCLTAYSYIATWYFLPIFLIGLVYLVKKNQLITNRQIIILTAIATLCIIPIVIFAGIQFFGDNNVSLFKITIPKLLYTQNEGQTILYNDNLFISIIDNLREGISLLIHGVDGARFSTLNGFGFIYNLAGVFLLFLGVVKIIRKKDLFSKVIFLWLLAAIPCIVIVTPLVHHWNIIMFPLIIIASYGLESLWVYTHKVTDNMAIVFFLCLFVLFIKDYTSNQEMRNGSYIMSTNLKTVINKTNKFENVLVYRDSLVQQGDLQFIYFRFFDPISPYEWQSEKDEPYSKENNITRFKYGKYYFYSDNEEIENLSQSDSVFILGNRGKTNITEFETNQFKVEKIDEFTLIYK